MSPERIFSASTRAPVRLGPELGRGGEGAVHGVEGRPDDVAKLYLSPPEPRKADKLRALAALHAQLPAVAAWPKEVLLDAAGAVRGFVMPRVKAHRDAHELYSPKSREEAFPEADFRFLVHVAANVARAFALVHEHGIVVGDVNHGNVMVSPDGTVMLIDCDSFQVRTPTALYPCDVGVPLFTPPELQGQSLRGRERTEDHDRFGLAVLLFHLLFMGRHPFAGRFRGAGEMPIERAIAEHRFAYGGDPRTQMEPPPATVALSAMGSEIAGLFQAAFGPRGAAGERPRAQAWVAALDGLERRLRSCSRASWHHHLDGLAACPWCEIEGRTGVRLFGMKLVGTAATGAVDLEALWKAIASVPRPPAAPPLPSSRPWSPPPELVKVATLRPLRRAAARALVLGGASIAGGCMMGRLMSGVYVGLALVAAAVVVRPRRGWSLSVQAAEDGERLARRRWNELLERWEREASRRAFEAKLAHLRQSRERLAKLAVEFDLRFQQLRTEVRGRQLARYLDRFRLDRAHIRGIDPSHVAMLAAYGIETAADLERAAILKVPGFARKRAAELLRWRKAQEKSFRFDASERVDPRELAAARHDLALERQRLVAALSAGPLELQQAAQGVAAAQAHLAPLLEHAWQEHKLAVARVEMLKA